MPSVGSLLISIKAETESLRADLSKGMAKIDAFTRSGVASGQKVSSGFDKIGLSSEKLGRNLGKVVSGALLMSGAMEKSSPVANGLVQTMGAFLAGGPIAAGIVGITSLVEVFTEKSRKAAEAEAKRAEEAAKAAEKRRAAVQSEIEDIEKLEKEAERAWQKARGRKGAEKELDAEDALKASRGEIARLQMGGLTKEEESEFPRLLALARLDEERKRRALAAIQEARLAEERETLVEQMLAEEQARIDAAPPERQMVTDGGGRFREVAPGVWERMTQKQIDLLSAINRNLDNVGRLGR